MLEIRIKRVEGGYQYSHRIYNGSEVATADPITAFDALRSVISQIEEWEKEELNKGGGDADKMTYLGLVEKYKDRIKVISSENVRVGMSNNTLDKVEHIVKSLDLSFKFLEVLLRDEKETAGVRELLDEYIGNADGCLRHLDLILKISDTFRKPEENDGYKKD